MVSQVTASFPLELNIQADTHYFLILFHRQHFIECELESRVSKALRMGFSGVYRINNNPSRIQNQKLR